MSLSMRQHTLLLHNQTIPKEESRRRLEDLRGSMRRCWQREEVQESKGPKVQRFQGPGVELDSKEGPSYPLFRMQQGISIYLIL